MSLSPPVEVVEVDGDVLAAHPLPDVEDGDDKEQRGRVLVVGGSSETPGAVLLAGVAALRAGAGKLQLATASAAAIGVGLQVPEARVIALPETGTSALDPGCAARVAELAEEADALLVGPGLLDADAVDQLMGDLLPALDDVTVVLDAYALHDLGKRPEPVRALGGDVLLTPNPGEMAELLDVDFVEVESDPAGCVRRAASSLRATVALRGATTWIGGPDGPVFCDRSGNVGLATSGSGDVLVGVVAALAARGADALAALLWAVRAHGRAGERLAERIGGLGYLPRELLDELAPTMAELAVTNGSAGSSSRRRSS